MAIVDLYLYRMKLVSPYQRLLFGEELTRSEVFLRILEERPSIEVRRGYFWHIGNIEFIDSSGGYFAAGRTTRSTLQRYDEGSGNFVEDVLETSPYTHVLFDCRIGFLAVAKKPRLAPTANGISKKIAHLFQATSVVRENELAVSIDPIPDPHDFIDSVREAYSVKRFEVTFSRSNPFDADEYFQKPMEKYLDASNATNGRTTISGEELDAETLIGMTKSVAATGNDAKARIKVSQDARLSTRQLSGNPAHFTVLEDEFDPITVLQETRGMYARIRGLENE